MELIVISNPFALADEGKLINSLFHSGLKYFHIRKPEYNYQSLKELLNDIEPRFYNRIALHQYHEMSQEFGIKRLHFTESARRTTCLKTMRKQRAEGFTLSTSIHDISSLFNVEDFHYVFYGPVFNSISKGGYQSTVSEDYVLAEAVHKTKVIALGGVQATNLKRIKEMGFDGAGVLGALWSEPHHALERFIQLKQQLPY